MLRVTYLSGLLLLVCVPGSLGYSFVDPPGMVRGDVTGSVTLELMLDSEPGPVDAVGFKFMGADVFRYIPYTGDIPPRVLDGTVGDPIHTNASYDPRFTIHNTSTRGVGFRLAGLRPEDAGTYTCGYASLDVSVIIDAVLFVYDVPRRPVIEARPQTLIEGVRTVSFECDASSTSVPVEHRQAMLYTWSRNGVNINRTTPPERHAVLGDRGQILEISPVHHTDTTYTCTASESGTNLTSEEAEITLDVLPPLPIRDNFIVIVASATGGVILLLIVVVTAILCVRRKRKPASEYVNSKVLGEPGHPVRDYVNSEVFREPGHPMGDYVNSEVFREPGHPMGDYVNFEIVRKPISTGHQPADASGQYERMDMATRQPADPINRVYAALQQ